MKLKSDLLKICHLYDTLPDAVVVVDNAGNIIMANQRAVILFGYSRTELLKKSVESLMPKQFRHKHIKDRENYKAHPKVRPMGIELGLFGLKKDGTEFSAEISLSPLTIDKVQFTVAIIRDITQRIQTAKEQLLLASIVEFSDDAIIGEDLKGIILSWNKGAEKIYGYMAEDAVGQSILKLFPQDRRDELDIILRKIKRGESLMQFETVRARKDGKSIPVSDTISPVYNKHNKIMGAVTVTRNITEQKKTEAKLLYLSEHDTLTGLINHVILNDMIKQATAWAKRYQSGMAVCFIDLDDFKKVNDTYGHATGDKVLAATAKRFQSCLREVDNIARIGGDEFSLILLEITDAKHAIRVVKKILKTFEESFDIDALSIKVTCSIGVALYPYDSNHHSLLEKADAAMYYVKEHGKNNFKLFDKTCHFREKQL
jgi:diguanylate cyclase (GGDEF)-like protein/PAS domain S-box-containing protein